MDPLNNPNLSAEEIYEALVKKAGLYGKAFYGHKKSRAEAKKLLSLYKLSIRTVEMRKEKRKSIEEFIVKDKEKNEQSL